MTYATIDDLRSQLGKAPAPSGATAEYAAKMLHAIPDAPVVDRAAFILKRCEGRRVLEFGASGPMHDAIVKTSSFALGVDLTASHVAECSIVACAHGCVIGFDLDDVSKTGLPGLSPDVIVCGEVLEHLTNPGWFLRRLRKQYAGVPVIVTVPNAFCVAGSRRYLQGTENVNRDHVSWYSYTTITKLLEKCGYSVLDWAWYNGQPLTAEGLVVVCI